MALEHYLKEIRKYPTLRHEEEKRIASLARKGDLSSRELLIKSNLRLVIKIAIKYSKGGISEDLIQQGNQGLVQAVDGFEPGLGYFFSTYATPWIKNGIFSYFEEQEIIKLPFKQRELRKRIYKFIISYLGKHLREPSDEQIAAELNKNEPGKYSERDVKELLQIYENIKVSSLNKPLGKDAEEEHIDILEGSNRNVLESISEEATVNMIRYKMNNLNADRLTKIILRGKLFNNKSTVELARYLGLKKEKVEQIYEKGTRLLKRNLMTNPKFIGSRNSFQDIT